MINNAGFSSSNELLTYPEKVWEKTYKINLKAPYELSKIFAPFMIKQKSGVIINITSLNSELAFPDNPAYVSSKSALDGLTRSMSLDLGKKGIRVNSIAPGYITTEMTSKSWLNKNKRRVRADKTILRRWGKPSEIVGPLLFLASDFSSYVTGHSLIVDGGWSIKGL